MPSITVIGKNAPPKQKLDWLCFPSPDSRWTLKLHSPDEWHYGAVGFATSLFLDGDDVSESHSKLTSIENPKGVEAKSRSIWSYDSRDIFLTNWNRDKVIRYRVTNKTIVDFCESVMSLQCAPDSDRILCADMYGARIVNASGEQIASFAWQSPKYEMPMLFWLQPSSCVAVIGRSTRRAKTQITFHSSQDGSVVQKLPLDRRELIPFDSDAYSGFGRQSSLLQISQNTWTDGEQLDTWQDCRFEPTKGDLYLSCYQPTTKPFLSQGVRFSGARKGTLVCKVKKVWLQFRITQ